MITKVSTVGMSREEWLEHRRKSIGGSDAAGIIGLSQWSTPYAVWADKTGRLPEKEDNEAMRLGRDLEQYVAERFCEATGKKVRRINAIIYNDAYPYSHADIDRDIVGENAILECKTTSTLDVKQFHGTDFPEQYYTQCVHYMAVTGAERCYLAVLVFGRGFFTYTLDRDEDEIKALMDAEAAFWTQYVQTDTPPAVDGEKATTDALSTIYADGGDGGIVELFGRERLLDEYQALKEQKKAVEGRLTEIENVLKEDLQDAERGTCANYTVIWSHCDGRKTFSDKDFAKDHPEINLSGYYKVGKPSRRFTIKKHEEEQ